MTSDPKNLVLMGIFGAAVGLKGEVRLKSYTSDPVDIADYSPLLAKDGRSFVITSVRAANEVVIVRVEGVTRREDAERLTNLELFVARDRLGDTDDEDEFFHADLIGLRAETGDGHVLGTVAALYDFGAGDMIEIRPPKGKALVYPFTKAIVPVVDLAGGKVVIAPPPEVDGKDGQDG
ncbi:MAG: ribosome maturation factor RimM [Albidovulum sp.]